MTWLPEDPLLVNPDSEPIDESFEDLNLREALGLLRHAPRRVIGSLAQVARSPRLITSMDQSDLVPLLYAARSAAARQVTIRWDEIALFLGRMSGFLLALRGTSLLALTPNRTEESALVAGLPWLFLGFWLWVLVEFAAGLLHPAAQSMHKAAVQTTWLDEDIEWDQTFLVRRLTPFMLALLCAVFSYGLNSQNQFSTPGIFMWWSSIGLLVWSLSPQHWTPVSSLRNLRTRIATFYRQHRLTLFALLLIMLVGAFFRLNNLPATPPEMTSDHVEKLLDSQRVMQGGRDIFFRNNGGREVTQMYVLALLSNIPGLQMDFTLLKLLSALEGIILLPLLWWTGRELIGEDERELGNLVGLTLAALVAISYWHVALSRLGLRIVLTTLVASLLMIYLARGMRTNRLWDFVKAGLVLGFGLYMYQAVRMLPLVVIAGVGLTLLMRVRSLPRLRTTIFHSAMLVLVSAVIFIPMFRFTIEYPDDFWRRTAGRLFGDDMIETTDESGNIVSRETTPEERAAAFEQNLTVFQTNLRNAVLMYNWKGDVAWINGMPNAPAMDTVTGALLICGLGAWLMRMFRRRDPVDWLIPVMVGIMILPSALSLAYPIENPSATRMSGSLPPVYLMAALPLALVIRALIRIPWRIARVGLALPIIGGLFLSGSLQNYDTYFRDYQRSYMLSSKPYSEVGRVLRGFAESGGSFGNAFMIGYPYWWDHRAIGIEAGLLDWPNGIVSLDNLPRDLYSASQRTGSYRLNPNQRLLFILAPEDTLSLEQLTVWFPEGYAERITSYQPEDLYVLYWVQPLYDAGLAQFFETYYQAAP